jgi:hypothetical protein
MERSSAGFCSRMVAALWMCCRDEAYAGDTSPVPPAEVAAELGVEHLTSQQTLVAGMLRPTHLLDLVRNFTLFSQAGSTTVKLVARYQQFRAVHTAIARLRSGQTRLEHSESDQRGASSGTRRDQARA